MNGTFAPAMNALEKYELAGETLLLSADRSIYWETEKALIVSDLHFGKTGHFRKSGIPVPQSVYREDLQRLVSQLQFFKPETLIVVGDLFHSHANKEIDFFSKWRNDFSSLTIELVKGNHDILKDEWYSSLSINVNPKTLKRKGFCFQHDLADCAADDDNSAYYVFSGHIHPGVSIHGLGKQSLRFPCFYFTSTYCVLPAFSRFTGSVSIKPAANEVVFALVNNSIIRM
jgi:uncharacterized protein